MSRLIDKAELFNALSTEQTDDYQYKSKVYSIIGEMKAVDAVEVVRCKDCIFWGWHKRAVRVYTGEQVKRCGARNYPIEMNALDFCSRGKKGL